MSNSRTVIQSFSQRLWDTDPHSGLPGGSEGKESACDAGTRVRSLGWEDPLQEGVATHARILAWRTAWAEGHI